jgi:hypothetical protein
MSPLRLVAILASALVLLITSALGPSRLAAQQAGGTGNQVGGGGRGRGGASPPPLFLKETWRLDGRAHAIAPGESVVTSPDLELKLYGPCASAADPDQRIWVSGPPVNLWTGMCTAPFAATLRHKANYADLTGLARVRWVVRTSGFHEVRPIVKLADGRLLVAAHSDSSTTTFLEREFAFLDLRWMALDPKRVVTTGVYGPSGEASNWIAQPDLSRVDEIGFVDLMPGSGHGSGGWANVATIEVYARPVRRAGG